MVVMEVVVVVVVKRTGMDSSWSFACTYCFERAEMVVYEWLIRNRQGVHDDIYTCYTHTTTTFVFLQVSLSIIKPRMRPTHWAAIGAVYIDFG